MAGGEKQTRPWADEGTVAEEAGQGHSDVLRAGAAEPKGEECSREAERGCQRSNQEQWS